MVEKSTNKKINICVKGYTKFVDDNYCMTFSNDTGFTVNRILMLIPYALMEFEKKGDKFSENLDLSEGFCLAGFKFDETTSTVYISLDH